MCACTCAWECMARTDGGVIDLIKMKVIDSVMNLQHLVYIIQKAELHLGSYIKLPLPPPPPQCTITHSKHLNKLSPFYIILIDMLYNEIRNSEY